MGLYLAVFDGEEEVSGVQVGSYADFGAFRDTVAEHLERGDVGSRFPTLMLHSNCEGSWLPEQAPQLRDELANIGDAFRQLPPIPFQPGSWQSEVARLLGLDSGRRASTSPSSMSTASQ
jgi:hypothetical protein